MTVSTRGFCSRAFEIPVSRPTASRPSDGVALAASGRTPGGSEPPRDGYFECLAAEAARAPLRGSAARWRILTLLVSLLASASWSAPAPERPAPVTDRVTQITHTPSVAEVEPAFLDGRRIAYLRGGGTAREWQRELWAADASGRNPRRLLGPGCFSVRVSHPRRRWLACGRTVEVRPVGPRGSPLGWQARTEVWAVSPAGRPHCVAPAGSTFLDGWTSGGRLALHEGRLGYDDIEGFHEATGFPPLRAWSCIPWASATLRPLAGADEIRRAADRGSDRDQLEHAGVWAPDGSGCIRVRWLSRGEARRIAYEYHRAGRPPVRLLETEEVASTGRPWLPAITWVDSRRVLLQQNATVPGPAFWQTQARSSLVVVNVSGAKSRPLAPGLSLDASPDPVVSPDGTQVLVRVLRPRRAPEVWLAAVDGSGCRRLLTGKAHCTRWAWSVDGRSLVLSRRASGSSDLWRVDLGR